MFFVSGFFCLTACLGEMLSEGGYIDNLCFLLSYSIPLYEYTTLYVFVLLWIFGLGGDLSHVQFGVPMNKSAVNQPVQAFFCECKPSSSWGIFSGAELLGPRISGYGQSASMDEPTETFTHSAREFSLLLPED